MLSITRQVQIVVKLRPQFITSSFVLVLPTINHLCCNHVLSYVHLNPSIIYESMSPGPNSMYFEVNPAEINEAYSHKWNIKSIGDVE